MFHAVFLLLFVLFASDLMAFVPMAVLAALLFVVAWGMSEAKRFLMLLRMPLGERAVLIVTFLLTILVDLTVAIGVGVTLASLMFMAKMSERGGVASGGDDEGEDLAQRDRLPKGVEVFRINGPFFFGVAGELLEALKRIGQPPRTIILRLELVPFLDSSGAISLAEFLAHAKAAGICVILSGMTAEVRDVLIRVGEGRPDQKMIHAVDYDAALLLAAR